MTTLYKKKKYYNIPEIITIVLDNEISLALESTPPEGEGEGALLIHGHLPDDPFKKTIC